MRAEVERAYRDGGGVTTVDELIPDPMPATKAPGTRELIDIHRDQQLQKLKAGQEKLSARRAEQQKQDEQARWFALAQGMLAPTKTGGFGESLGATAGLLRQEQELSRRGMSDILDEEMLLAGQESDVGADYISQLQAQERIEKTSRSGRYQSGRTPVGVPGLFPHPEDPNRDMRAQEVWDADKEVPQFNDDGTPMLDENGEQVVSLGAPELVPLGIGPDGSVPFATSQFDVWRKGELSNVTNFSQDYIARASNDIEGARDAWIMIPKLERTMTLLEDVGEGGPGTSGWVALVQGLQEWFGVDTRDVTNIGVLRHRLGQNVLEALKHFPGQISEGERKYAEKLETSISKSTSINIELIREGLKLQRERWTRGKVSAVELARNPNLKTMMRLDFLAMGLDPDNLDKDPIGSDESIKKDEVGSTRHNPLPVGPNSPRPATGTWVQYTDPATGELVTKRIGAAPPLPE
jgi:hypothetical protein